MSMFQSIASTEVIATGFIFRSPQTLPFIPRSLSSPTRKPALRYIKWRRISMMRVRLRCTSSNGHLARMCIAERSRRLLIFFSYYPFAGLCGMMYRFIISRFYDRCELRQNNNIKRLYQRQITPVMMTNSLRFPSIERNTCIQV